MTGTSPVITFVSDILAVSMSESEHSGNNVEKIEELWLKPGLHTIAKGALETGIGCARYHLHPPKWGLVAFASSSNA
jgi:hypothetical protein